MSVSFIQEHAKTSEHWYFLSINKNITEPVIECFLDHWDWNWISSNVPLSESFIRKHADRVNWKGISMCQNLSLAFIQENEDKINFRELSFNASLTEDIMETYAGKLDWNKVVFRATLSESFIEKHIWNEEQWSDLIGFQFLTFPFIKKHVAYINMSDCRKKREEWIFRLTDEQFDILEQTKEKIHTV